jgi:NADH:ubiquinone oxidoreductase subunit B-like Fe-S oxidoreductase
MNKVRQAQQDLASHDELCDAMTFLVDVSLLSWTFVLACRIIHTMATIESATVRADVDEGAAVPARQIDSKESDTRAKAAHAVNSHTQFALCYA